MASDQKNRQMNFELLRVVAMLMVVCLHYISKSGALAAPETLMTPTRAAGGLLESFCIVAVDVYVLISGYFLSEAVWKPGRIVRLWLEILFYSALIPVVILLCGGSIRGTDAWTAAFYVLPVSMQHYWFATAYFLMYLFAPLLNIAVRKMTRRQLQCVIAALLVVFCFLKSFSPVQLTIDRAGYNADWFVCLYLIGAYLRRYGWRRLESIRRSAVLYIGSSLGTFALYCVLHMFCQTTGQLQYYAAVPFHYNAVLCLTGALGLFGIFRNIRVRQGSFAAVIRALAPMTFGVYLIHEHIDLMDRWPEWMHALTGEVRQDRPVVFVLQAVVSVLMIYLVCVLIDRLRIALFSALGRLLRNSAPARKLREIDGWFAPAPAQKQEN